MDRDSIGNTLRVAIGVSLVCSIFVASAALLLKPQQLLNEEQFRQRIILNVAGIDASGDGIAAAFGQIEARLLDFETGEFVTDYPVADFDALEAAASSELGVAIPADLDIAGVRRRARYGEVYIVRDGNEIEQLILPVRGAGLWSTLYGYLAVEADGNTARGLQFYSHAETPGLGDQMDKPAWIAQWLGKQLYGPDGQPRVEVIKGTAAPDSPHDIDGLAGATLTGRGITQLVHYWIGDHAYGPYLRSLQEAQGS